MPVEQLVPEPAGPEARSIRMGARAVDVGTRTVVVGLLDVATGAPEAALTAATALRDQGAAVVELDGPAEVLQGVLSAPEVRSGGPWGCRVGSPEVLEVAATAGIELVTLADPALAEPLRSRLGPGPAGPWWPTVIATAEVLDAMAPAYPVPERRGRAVLDRTLDDPGLLTVPSIPAGSFPAGWAWGVTLAGSWEHDVAAATTLAVVAGCRVVRTPWVRSARRAGDLVATLLIERSGGAGRTGTGCAASGGRR